MKYQEFINKAIKKHGNKYIYPEFNNENGKIIIICPEHGEFTQNIYAHIKGQGCPQCLGRKNYTTEKFINECKLKFGDKFDYSETVFKNKRTKILIKCEELITKENQDGRFEMLPFRHLDSNTGMPFLGRRGIKYSKITDENKIKQKTEKFKNKFLNKFGNKYGLDNFIYLGCSQKSIFTCPIHGDFESIPSNIIQGHGCPKCAKNRKLTTKEFVKKANEKHKNKYDYSKIEYLKSDDKICIICPEHGEFLQNTTHHLNGIGCPKCAKNIPLTTEEFIERSNIIHNFKYNYSKTKYIRSYIKTTIICPKHGEFNQSPRSHLSGDGCPKCSDSHMEKNIRELLDENTIKYETEYKIKSIYDKRELPFDFYLPEHNILIECQGHQHFYNTFFCDLEDRIKKDKIKYHGSIKENIKLLYFSNIKNIKQYIKDNQELFGEMYNKNFYTNKQELIKKIKEGK